MKSSKASRSKAKHDIRGFRLTVQPIGEEFGLELFELNGNETLVARANPGRTREIATAIQLALKTSGHNRTVLSARRKAPITLREDAGVRLALVLLATEGVKKGRRKSNMVDAVDYMATEEAYYWYAKCVGADGPRVKRALRLFLAEE